MVNIANQNVPTVMGIIFSNVGLVLNPTQVNIWAAIITAGAGVVTVAITFFNAFTKRRIMRKNELKTDLEVRKAELELILLEKEVQNQKDDADNRKDTKRL